MNISLTNGFLKVSAGVLTNLAAGWFGAVLIFPQFIEFRSPGEALVVLTYSMCFGILSMLAASRIEDYLYGK
jgi:hypothetical protein